VADAQISMCESLEASLSLSLETFIGTELEEATRLKDEAESMTESAESSFAKYLHGKHAHNSSGTESDPNQSVSSWNKISEGVGNHLGRIGMASTSNVDVSLSPSKGRRSKKDSNAEKSKDPMEKAISAAHLRQNLEEIRYSQANAEFKRFELLKHVDALKVRKSINIILLSQYHIIVININLFYYYTMMTNLVLDSFLFFVLFTISHIITFRQEEILDLAKAYLLR
jgi:hypothetical protein